jgi:hypothetical protein
MTDEATGTELALRDEVITVSRERLTLTLNSILHNLPDILETAGNDLPMMLKAGIPALRMVLASTMMEETLSSGAITDYVWEQLVLCQNV